MGRFLYHVAVQCLWVAVISTVVYAALWAWGG